MVQLKSLDENYLFKTSHIKLHKMGQFKLYRRSAGTIERKGQKHENRVPVMELFPELRNRFHNSSKQKQTVHFKLSKHGPYHDRGL